MERGSDGDTPCSCPATGRPGSRWGPAAFGSTCLKRSTPGSAPPQRQPLEPAPVVEFQSSGPIPVAEFAMLNQATLRSFTSTKSLVAVLSVAFPHPPPPRGRGGLAWQLALSPALPSQQLGESPLAQHPAWPGRRAELAPARCLPQLQSQPALASPCQQPSAAEQQEVKRVVFL